MRRGRKVIRRMFAISLVVTIASVVVGRGTPADQKERSALERLGARLFVSSELSDDGTRACASCHVPAFGFSGAAPVATTREGEPLRRRAPALYGVTSMTSLMWDGRAPDLEHQILLPLEGSEMHIDWTSALDRLRRHADLFSLAHETERLFDRDLTLAALAAYVRSLDRAQSRFDQFIRGDGSQLSESEQRGFRVFQRKARCSSCHLVDSRSAPFTDGVFHVTGAGLSADPPIDRGRAEATGAPQDALAFKTPSLRGVALRPFLLHNGRMRSLREVINYYNGIDPKAVPGTDPRLAPLHLVPAEIDDLIAFLRALTPEVAPPI